MAPKQSKVPIETDFLVLPETLGEAGAKTRLTQSKHDFGVLVTQQVIRLIGARGDLPLVMVPAGRPLSDLLDDEELSEALGREGTPGLLIVDEKQSPFALLRKATWEELKLKGGAPKYLLEYDWGTAGMPTGPTVLTVTCATCKYVNKLRSFVPGWTRCRNPTPPSHILTT
jgi:hypothetical protein